jgi:predicted nuclease with TOPRIM domain
MNIRGRIKRLEDELKSARNELEKAEKSLSKLPEVDMLMDKRGKLQSEISKAIGVNAKIEEKTRYLSIKEKASSLEDEYDEMSEKISGLEKEKVALLKKADMPINGLSIDDEGVLYKGIPFGQLASSEQLKVSLAIAISLNPELRVLRITDGSLLDEDNLKLISDIAGKTDYQIWIEKVDESGEVGIFIEDGEIKKNNYK